MQDEPKPLAHPDYRHEGPARFYRASNGRHDDLGWFSRARDGGLQARIKILAREIGRNVKDVNHDCESLPAPGSPIRSTSNSGR